MQETVTVGSNWVYFLPVTYTLPDCTEYMPNTKHNVLLATLHEKVNA